MVHSIISAFNQTKLVYLPAVWVQVALLAEGRTFPFPSYLGIMTLRLPYGLANPALVPPLRVLRTGLCWSCLVLGGFSCESEGDRPPDAVASKPWPASPAKSPSVRADEHVERDAALSPTYSPAQRARIRALLDSRRQAKTIPLPEPCARAWPFPSPEPQKHLAQRARIRAQLDSLYR
jgi:hypothetical protein